MSASEDQLKELIAEIKALRSELASFRQIIVPEISLLNKELQELDAIKEDMKQGEFYT